MIAKWNMTEIDQIWAQINLDNRHSVNEDPDGKRGY